MVSGRVTLAIRSPADQETAHAATSTGVSSKLLRPGQTMSTSHSGVSIPLTGLAKQTLPGKTIGMDPLCLSAFQQADRLCPVRYFREYLTHTEAWRKEQPQLFLAIPAPHEPVTSSAIAQWLKDAIE